MASKRVIGRALEQLSQFCDQQGWDYCLIGGLAASYWGEPRFTKDVDFVVFTGFGDEADFISKLAQAFELRMPDAAEFALLSRVLILNSPEGVALDVSFGAIDFEGSVISRAKLRAVLRGVKVPTATAEDIVVMKAIAGRPQDVKDIEGIIAAQGKKLDLTYIRHWLENLAEMLPEVDVLGRFEEILASVNTRMKNSPKPNKPRKKKAE